MPMSVKEQQGLLNDLVLFLNHTFDSEPETDADAFKGNFGSEGPFAAGVDLGPREPTGRSPP